jgi:hypothetical protein
MNQEVEKFARDLLASKLAQLPAANLRIFKLMYGRNGGRRSVEAAEAMPIADVVAAVPFDKIYWAIQQCEATIKKNAASGVLASSEAQRLLPVKATPEMEAAGNAAIIEGGCLAKHVWAAMVKAAPAAGVQPSDGGLRDGQ